MCEGRISVAYDPKEKDDYLNWNTQCGTPGPPVYSWKSDERIAPVPADVDVAASDC